MPFIFDLPNVNAAKRCIGIVISVACLVTFLSTSQVVYSQDIIPAFDVPNHSRGLAWAWDKLWVGGVAERGNWIWAYDPVTGELLDSLPAPVPDCLSLEGHKEGLVYLSSRNDSTYLVTERGVRSFSNPFRHFAGLGSDGDNLWGATFFEPQGTLFKMDMSGRILHAVPFGGTQSRDMAFLKGRLYIADQLTQNVRIIDPTTGRLIRNLAVPGNNPSGVASDGHGIWVLNEGDAKPSDQIYHVNMRPEGGIRLSALQHNFGSVIVNDSREWNLWIYNDGPRSTRLVTFEARDGNEDIFIPHVWNFPQTIDAGDSIALGISFVPAYQDSVHIYFAITYDLDRVENVVDIRGKGVRRQRNILVPLRNLTFGLCYYGIGSQNSNLRYLIIENAGGEPLTVSEIRFSNNSFLTGGIEFPHTFTRPGAYRIPVFFRPNSNSQIRGTGTIFSDDPDSPEINFSLSGEGRLYYYPGGTPLWNVVVGDPENELPQIRALQPIDDVSGDELADVVVASNDNTISCYHAASTLLATPFWTYYTNANPWRSGLVPNSKAMSEGSDWDRDGRKDVVFGLGGGALTIVALSGNTGEELWTVDTHGLPGYGGIPVVIQATKDFTGDNFNDVIVATAAQNEHYTTRSLFMINSRSSRVAWFAELPANPFDVVCQSDLTGDDISDLIVVLTDGTIIGIDGGGGNRIYDTHVVGDVRAVVPCSDVNGDGSKDICIATYNNGLYMINGSNGSLIWHREGTQEVVLLCQMNDLNGNGSEDLVYGSIRSFFMAIEGRTGANIWGDTYQVGSTPLSLVRINDFSGDSKDDYVVGTAEGRLYALSGNGRDALWSYSNVHEGHGFNVVVASRDIDGNDEMDIFAGMVNGTVYAFAGSYLGNNTIEDNSTELPVLMSLYSAYPNPFNSSVTIPFTLNSTDDVAMKVFDVTGREIFVQQPQNLQAGLHRLVWNGMNIDGQPAGSGLYFVRVESNFGNVVRQVQLLR